MGESKPPTSPIPKTKAAPASSAPSTPRRSIDSYSQDELVGVLTKAAPRRWIEREELLKLAASNLGFTRVGANIRKSFKSAFNGAIRRGLFEYEGERVRRKPSTG
jgi:hypothetical protein